MSLIVFLSSLTRQLDLILTSELENMDLPLLQGKMPMMYDDDDDDDDGRDYHHKGRCSSKYNILPFR